MSSQIEELKSFIVAIVLKRNIQYNQRLQHREIGAVFYFCTRTKATFLSV